MAKSTTYKGAVKPFGKSGHFDESKRHSLQAKGIKTGHYALEVGGAYVMSGLTKKEFDFTKQRLKREGRSFVALKDSDHDGVPDKYDCAPHDPTRQDNNTPDVQPTFDSSRYEYDTGDLYATKGYNYTGREIIDNKILQENLKGQPIIIQRGTSEEWGLFDGAGYDRSKKRYYVAYKRQEKPRGGLTGEITGRFFLNSRYDSSIKIIKIRGKRMI